MRRALSSFRQLVSTRPRLIPFVPVLARWLLRRRAYTPEALPRVSPAVASVSTVGGSADLVVFSVIRNGISNGYPFVEAYGNWLGRADRIVIVDGESDDGTREALDRLAALDSSVKIESAPWPSSRTGGSSIAELTNTALLYARD